MQAPQHFFSDAQTPCLDSASRQWKNIEIEDRKSRIENRGSSMEKRKGRRPKAALADDKILAQNEDLIFTTASFEFTAQDTEITFRCSATGSEHGDLAVDVRLELNA